MHAKTIGKDKTGLVTVEICRPCSGSSIQISADRRLKKIRTQPYQLRKAAQVWLLKVIQFTIETVPFSSCLFLLLIAGKLVQFTGVLVERKTK